MSKLKPIKLAQTEFRNLTIAMIYINDIAGEWDGCIMYEIYCVNFWVIILCTVLKPENFLLKNLGFFLALV